MGCSRLTALLCCVAPFVAHAQYAPHSLGRGPHLATVVGSRSLMWGLSLEFSNYLDSGFEFFGRVPLLIAETPVGAETTSGAGRVFATGASVGVRYLFLEGMVRPWVGLQLGGVVLVTQPEVTWFLGAGRDPRPRLGAVGVVVRRGARQSTTSSSISTARGATSWAAR